MLGVDRARSGRAWRGSSDQRAADDQRLLVGQRERVAGVQRRQRRAQPDRAGDAVEHDVARPARRPRSRRPRPARTYAGRELGHLLLEQLGVAAARGQPDHPEPVRVGAARGRAPGCRSSRSSRAPRRHVASCGHAPNSTVPPPSRVASAACGQPVPRSRTSVVLRVRPPSTRAGAAADDHGARGGVRARRRGCSDVPVEVVGCRRLHRDGSRPPAITTTSSSPVGSSSTWTAPRRVDGEQGDEAPGGSLPTVAETAPDPPADLRPA